MKKWPIAILILLLLLVASTYIFIPNIISVNKSMPINVTQQGLQRNLFDEKTWTKWWPGSSGATDNDSLSSFIFNGYTYTISGKNIFSLPISITQKDTLAITTLTFVSTRLDSTQIYWQAAIPTSYNPLKRLQIYFKAKQISNDMMTILEKIQSFYSRSENVYGYIIGKGAIVDSVFVSTFSISKGYPSTEFTYGLINQLKKHIISQSAKETGFAITEVTTNDSINFFTRVAIPVDRRLPSSGNIAYKSMPPGVTHFTAEVKGGFSAINKAFRQIANYMNDHQTMIATTPFYILVTDRSQQPDSSKWITRLCFPYN
jgi:hypothetical protein